MMSDTESPRWNRKETWACDMGSEGLVAVRLRGSSLWEDEHPPSALSFHHPAVFPGSIFCRKNQIWRGRMPLLDPYESDYNDDLQMIAREPKRARQLGHCPWLHAELDAYLSDPPSSYIWWHTRPSLWEPGGKESWLEMRRENWRGRFAPARLRTELPPGDYLPPDFSIRRSVLEAIDFISPMMGEVAEEAMGMKVYPIPHSDFIPD
uniref:Uncharacterized protein n=1 Tax=Chromera velia CCMP2878 TaxID=1169474 RepID=A0A0G4I9S1_9ALVE|eukprot:Cvel_12243.t1-p1 / transcript=Cvel_12243.t1 / gene=Cvel_12243 / organism=Chromera_velia_CCMP2878 / gene_product=hypothetical protein / transcript_product=hypothetical protein / location=Cvel_scaffold793:10370-11317(-) / protein_length=206 / sequence_SO=supercontig / SO=protein_coding / is_pseudo=false